MQSTCGALANTGANLWQIAGIAICLLLAGVFLVLFLQRKHGVHYKFGRGGMAIMALLLIARLLISSPLVHAAPATTCPSTKGTVSNTTAPVTNPNALELVNDSYNDENGFYYSPGNFQWSGTFNILANDHAPAGDPIDPTTVKLVGDWPSYSQFGQPLGTSYWILDPSDPSNPNDPNNPTDPNSPWGQFWLSSIDGNGNSTNGLVSATLNGAVPLGQTFTIQYTAKTMSGVVATHTAVISVTNDATNTAPAPTLVDNSFNLGTNYANGGNSFAYLQVLPNDQPQPGDPLDPSTLQLVDPTDSNQTGPFYTTYADLGDQANSWINWYADSGVIKVQFGPSVPELTPFTIQYTANSLAGVPPVAPATITVTRDSTINSPIVAGTLQLGHDCNVGGPDVLTGDLAAAATTSVGVIDPASVDLDPATPGQQTTITNNLGTFSVDTNGIVTMTNFAGNVGIVPYTIANSLGDVSQTSAIFVINNNFCV